MPTTRTYRTRQASASRPRLRRRPKADSRTKLATSSQIQRPFGARSTTDLRYVILPHRGQPGRASLRLYINIGSAVEDDDQQGMAHFLEHMAFNGTRNFPAGESLKYFQRLGMAFVAHTNAATGLDSTVYKLELPRVEDELTRQSLTFFRDVLDGMNLDEHEIEQERRVILSEMLARNSANYRSTVAGLQFALPDSKYSRRMPIGTTDCIRGMSRKQFIDFYETWYTPARATIVAAGDLERGQHAAAHPATLPGRQSAPRRKSQSFIRRDCDRPRRYSAIAYRKGCVSDNDLALDQPTTFT